VDRPSRLARSLPHPRLHRPADFLFVERGRRLSASRLRHGLDTAAVAAGLRTRDDRPLHPTPHRLRHTYAATLINAGMSPRALMALLGHVSTETTEMTLRYASLAAPTLRAAYEDAMNKAHTRLALPIAPVVPDHVRWLHSEMFKSRLGAGYCSRHQAAGPCPHANICEQCDSFITTPDFIPALKAQLADLAALRVDADERGWHTESVRHSHVIESIERHMRRHAKPAARG
jgi:hypothetical protein